MYDSSMLYTMGMALSRALDNNASVDVLVDGEWLRGTVVLYDGTGVVLDNGEDHSIVRVDHITAVKVMSMSPMRAELEGRATAFGEPMPMPGPRMAQTA
jgi:hypothetical protein